MGVGKFIFFFPCFCSCCWLCFLLFSKFSNCFEWWWQCLEGDEENLKEKFGETGMSHTFFLVLFLVMRDAVWLLKMSIVKTTQLTTHLPRSLVYLNSSFSFVIAYSSVIVTFPLFSNKFYDCYRSERFSINSFSLIFLSFCMLHFTTNWFNFMFCLLS